MEFRVLGPVTVLRNGIEIDLGAPKQRALLTLLLVHRNTALSADRILEHLWGDDGDDKLNALRVHVSRLRDALDPERTRSEGSVLETVGTGYRLNVDDNHVDAAQFEELIADGRALLGTDPMRAAETLRTALDLWRGSPFEEFLYEQFTQFEAQRLSEIRTDAIEDRIEADLAAGLAGELVSELEVLRQEHPLRERLAAQQALALYRSGRPADALRGIERFRRYVGAELGIDPSPRLLRLEEQILLHDDRIQPRLPSAEGLLRPTRTAANPFKGLRPFGADDAGSFFGRDALIADLLRIIGRGQRLIALVGASGSGKSSVVRAGLVPALAKGAIEGSDQWLVASMVPGAHPFAELEAALLRSTIDAPASLAAQLDDGEAGLVRAALRVLPDNDARLLVVIDQFEELFTLVDDQEVRHLFLSNLVAAVNDPHGRITVLVNLRADFYGRPLAHPEFGARLGAGVVNVTPLTSEELEEAALQPAEQQGVSFEPALLGQLIADVGNRPGSLPLFQYALTELFDRRSGSTLMAASYRAMGGVEGALQRRASELFDELDGEQQRVARQVFLRLVVIGDDGQRSRRRVPAREIASIGVDTAIVQEVLRRFGERRLVSFDSDPLTGAPTVEVAHEALLTAWPMLDTWIGENRDELRRHASLATALREWQLADRHPDYLLSSSRVASFDGWDEASGISLNGPEQEFLAASAKHLAVARAEDERRRTEEVRKQHRLWTLVGTLGVALGIAALFLFGVFAADAGPTITYYRASVTDAVSDSITSGVERAGRELNMQVDDVQWVVDPLLEFTELAESRPGIVIVDSFVQLFIPEIFFDHPDIRFGVIDPDDGPVTALPNVSYASFRNEEGAFLAGVAAASTTETGVVGFVGGAQISLIEPFRAGFEAGVAAVDPDIEVLATFVGQFGAMGFGDVFAGEARAAALYERGADVVFHAAGLSGRGIFVAAGEQSEALGRHLWGIGVDVDQWFDTPDAQRDHVLTSMIKRADVAAFLLAEHLLAGGPGGEAVTLGLAEGGYDYSTRGDAMPPEVIATIDRFIADVTEGRINVPVQPEGPVLLLDNDGNEITEPPDTTPAGVDFPQQYSPISPGTYDLTALGTPLTVTIAGDWSVQANLAGFTAFSHPDSQRQGDRDVVFLRPTLFADPTRPAAGIGAQEMWPAGEMSLDRFDRWLDLLPDGIVVGAPNRGEIGGRDAVFFEVEIASNFECGKELFCVGFLINTFAAEGVTGWTFERGFRQRVWVVDGGVHEPLVIIASTQADDPGFQPIADTLLATLVIGDPQPHPSTKTE